MTKKGKVVVDIISAMIGALCTGAAHVANEAISSAYHALRKALTAIGVKEGVLDLLEEDPEPSEIQKGAVGEWLKKRGADLDEEAVARTNELLAKLNNLPEQTRTVGVLLDAVRAQLVHLQRIRAQGERGAIGVLMKNTEAKTILVNDVDASSGGGSPKKEATRPRRT